MSFRTQNMKLVFLFEILLNLLDSNQLPSDVYTGEPMTNVNNSRNISANFEKFEACLCIRTRFFGEDI